MDEKKISEGRRFVMLYWVSTNCKAVTQILKWIANKKLTIEGRKQYRILVNNLANKPMRNL